MNYYLFPLRYKHQIKPEIAAQLHRIDIAMNQCAERHLENPDLTLGQLNCILRAYNNRNSKIKQTPSVSLTLTSK